jgi:hypothetical protein
MAEIVGAAAIILAIGVLWWVAIGTWMRVDG